MYLKLPTTVLCPMLTAHWVLLCAGPGYAQMPLHPPEIRTIFPIGGVQGSTVEVLVDGQNVSNPSAVAISGEGVRASVVGEENAMDLLTHGTSPVGTDAAPISGNRTLSGDVLCSKVTVS